MLQDVTEETPRTVVQFALQVIPCLYQSMWDHSLICCEVLNLNLEVNIVIPAGGIDF